MKLLLVGPFPDPITGESLANEHFFNFLKAENYIVDRIDTSLGEISSIQGIFSLSKAFRAALPFFKVFKIIRVDVVYITPGQSFLGILKYAPFIVCASLLRKKIIMHIHGGKLRFTLKESSGFKLELISYLIGKADAGIVLSHRLRENFGTLLPKDRIYEVRNFATNKLFEIDFSSKKFDKLRILYLSNLMIEKGILDVIDGYLIAKERADIDLILAGNIERTSFQKIQRKIDEGKISYLGPVYAKDKQLLLTESNVLILPTYYKTEGQPISIIEGMVSGNYILTTDHAGIGDIIVDKVNGSFVSEKSPKEISELLLSLAKRLDHVKEVSKHNLNESRKMYTVNRFGEEIVSVMKSINKD
ncbi:glycosyltransferase family 4 protein [Ekhidna sp.]|uniref:glycosyltransferase family 4 protein n=1 Tax=Ekhidna sp. TaxID=2608089 RepID=UPI003BAA9089